MTSGSNNFIDFPVVCQLEPGGLHPLEGLYKSVVITMTPPYRKSRIIVHFSERCRCCYETLASMRIYSLLDSDGPHARLGRPTSAGRHPLGAGMSGSLREYSMVCCHGLRPFTPTAQVLLVTEQYSARTGTKRRPLRSHQIMQPYVPAAYISVSPILPYITLPYLILLDRHFASDAKDSKGSNAHPGINHYIHRRS